MMAPWDKSDTNEVVKAAAVALATTLVTKLAEWAVEELRERRSASGGEASNQEGGDDEDGQGD